MSPWLLHVRRASALAGAITALWGCHAIVGIEEPGGGGSGSTAAGKTTTGITVTATSSDATTAPTSDASTGAPATSTGTGSVYEDAVRMDGPLVYFRFEEPSGDAIESMSGLALGAVRTYTAGVSSQGGSGVQQGVASETAALGSAVRFASSVDGENGGYVVCTDSTSIAFDGTEPFSVELWAALQLPNNSFGYLISNSKDTPTGSDGYWIEIGKDNNNDDDDVYAYRAWITNGTEASYLGFNAGNFHHYVFTYDGTRTALYIDGDANPCSSSDCITNGPLSTTYGSNLVIGGSWNGVDGDTNANGGFLTGLIDEVAVYDYPLTAQQIAAHRAAAGL